MLFRSLIDAKILNDNNIHITYFSRTTQKISVIIEDIKSRKESTIFKGNFTCKIIGVNRIKLSNSIILPKGIFAVYFHSKDGVSSFLINNN